MLLAVGLEGAFIGVGRQAHNDVAVYDYYKCVEILMKKHKWTDEEAIEWMEYNVVGAYVGEKTPIFIMFGKEDEE